MTSFNFNNYNVYIIDIETNHIDLSKINKLHCVSFINYKTSASRLLTNIDNIQCQLNNADVLIGHNILKYDLPVLRDIFKLKFKHNVQIIDTLVLSRLVFPDKYLLSAKYKDIIPKKLLASYSLKAWGYRLGILKDDYQGGFDEYNDVMGDYCLQDTKVTLALYNYLMDSYEGILQSIQLEHQVARCISEMETYGFKFNLDKAQLLVNTIMTERDQLYKEITDYFGEVIVKTRTLVPKRDNKTKGYIKGEPKEITEKKLFNPNSRTQMIKEFTNRGYKFLLTTEKGTPKINDEVLEDIAKYLQEEIITKLVRYLLLQKRLSQLYSADKAWIKLVKPNNYIYGSVNTNGTATGRASHGDPNIAQVPRVGSPYGYECRELFSCDPDWYQIGIDVSGLELRGLSHYLYPYDNGKYAQEVVYGDVHTRNLEYSQGLIKNRNMAKSVIYALIYGAGNDKLALIIGGVPEQGKLLKELLLNGIEGYSELISWCRTQYNTKKYIKGLDGRIIPLRSSHATLNYLIQSSGAIICKKWLVLTYQALIKEGLRSGIDFKYHAWIHDELQIGVRDESLIKYVGDISINCIKQAGKYFNFKCELTGEYKHGRNWAETH